MSGAPKFDANFRAQLRDLLIWRRDVRHFRRDPVSDDTLHRLLQLACLSPSVGLSQPWRFVVVRDSTRRDAIRTCFEACNAEALLDQAQERASIYARLKLAGLDDAPCQVAVFADRSTTQGHGLGQLTMPEMIEYSAVLAAHTLWLAARAEGVGLGWLSILDPLRIAEILDVPAEWTLIGYLCLGYPVDENQTPLLEQEGWQARRPLTEVVVYR